MNSKILYIPAEDLRQQFGAGQLDAYVRTHGKQDNALQLWQHRRSPMPHGQQSASSLLGILLSCRLVHGTLLITLENFTRSVLFKRSDQGNKCPSREHLAIVSFCFWVVFIFGGCVFGLVITHTRCVLMTCQWQAFCFWKGDMEAHVLSHKTARNYRCSLCCDLCLAVKSPNNPVMNIGNLTVDAAWKRTISFVDPSDPSPWMNVPGFTNKKCRLLDILHIVHLGTLRDLIPACLIDALDDGTLAQIYGMQGQSEDLILYRMSQHAHRWAKDNNMDLYVGTLNLRRLGRPNQRHWPFPVLDSIIKAARTRTLFAFVTWLVSRLATFPCATQEQQLNAKVRAVCCWTLDTALSIFNMNKKIKMRVQVVRQTTWLCRLHSACHQWLGSRCIAQRRLLYKVRPKTHYFTHMVDHHEETCLCLLHLSTFGDEDFMGKIRKVAQSCHGKTYMHAWARRYVLKRALQWSEMKKENVFMVVVVHG